MSDKGDTPMRSQPSLLRVITLTLVLLFWSIDGVAQWKEVYRLPKEDLSPTFHLLSFPKFDEAPLVLHGTFSGQLLAPQIAALKNIVNAGARVMVWFDFMNNIPYWIHIESTGKQHDKILTENEVVPAFYNVFRNFAPIFLIENEKELSISRIWSDELQTVHIKARQEHRGIPIWGTEIIVHFRSNGSVYAIGGRLYPTLKFRSAFPEPNPEISAESAIAIVEKSIHPKSVEIDTIRLVYFPDRVDQSNVSLVWHCTIYRDGWDRWEYFVSAQDGRIIFCYRNTHFDGPTTAQAQDLLGVTRTIHTYQLGARYYLIDASRPMFDAQRSQLPNNPVGAILTLDANNTDLSTVTHITSTDNRWTDPASVSAHYNCGVTYQYFYTTHQRNSIDGAGGTMISVIHVTENGRSMANAFWNGKIMAYGDGGGIFYPFSRGLDVAAHEMTHGVTEHTANLVYLSQSGAINESMSDVFAAMVDREDWQIGEDVVLPQYFPSGAMRNLSDPHNGGSGPQDHYWQPKKMSEYVTLPETPEGDNGGVHINSGIPNYAAYLIATRIGREKTEKIYYRALTTYLTRSSQFVDLRRSVLQSAIDLYGDGQEAQAVRDAFDAVEIYDDGSSGGPGDLEPVQGQEWVLVYAPSFDALVLVNRSDVNEQYLVSASGLNGRPSVTDDGQAALFVAGDNTLHAALLTPGNIQEVILSNDPIWGNVAISPDGNRLAIVSNYSEPYIYIADLEKDPAPVQQFQIYTPDYSGANHVTVFYPDALYWSHDGRFVYFDMLNGIPTEWGDTLFYWDIAVLDAWNNTTKTFGSGIVSRVLPPFPEGISIGNPALSKNSPYIMAFDIFDPYNDVAYVAAANFEKQEISLLFQHQTLGYPSYTGDDRYLGFTTLDQSGNVLIALQPLQSNKIQAAGSAQGFLGGAAIPVFFRQGKRPTYRGEMDTNRRSINITYIGASTIQLYSAQPFSRLPLCSLYNTYGKLVAVLPIKHVSNNYYRIKLPDALPNGAYYLRIEEERWQRLIYLPIWWR